MKFERPTYEEFLRAKVALADDRGIKVEASEISPILKDHQAAIVRWALRKGRAAIFAAFGLGKTLMQLEIARILTAKLGGRFLIVCPLGVRQEFTRDATLTGVDVRFIRRIEECDQLDIAGKRASIFLTNYETVRDGKLDPRLFDGVSLDEAAVLRGFGGSKTFREFMRLFEGTGTYRFVATATPSPNEFIELLAYSAFLDVMDVGQAKAQPIDAKVLTPSGWRFMGELAPGDRVIAADGSATTVIGVYPQGERPIYRITFSDGSSTECDAEHLWLTQTQYERNNERRYRQRGGEGRRYESARTTEEIARTLRFRGGWNHSIPMAAATEFEPSETKIDPWLMGYLLGNGCLRATSVSVTIPDDWGVNEVAGCLPVGTSLKEGPSGIDYGITTTGRRGGNGPNSNPMLCELRALHLDGKRSWEKQIPDAYLFSPIRTRIAILQGLMDSDGTVGADGTQVRFCSTSIRLSEQVRFLVQSLGGTASLRTSATTGRDAHIVTMQLPGEVIPFRHPRKAARIRSRTKYPPRRFVVAVDFVGTKIAKCIAIDHPGRLYVTDEFIVTHNTRFFRRNSEKADQLTLHPHKEREFWLWVSSWAIFLQRPSDLGFSDEGYVLPALEVHWHELAGDGRGAGVEANGQGRLIADTTISVQNAAREKRESLEARIAKLLELRKLDPAAHRMLWHDLESERKAIEMALPDAVTVYGSQDLDARELSIIDFSDGKIPELAGKPSMLGSGCNFQRHCHWAIFLGIGFKFAEFIQSIHRLYRFLQTDAVRIDLIYTEAEREVRRILERKWEQHREQTAQMTDIIRRYGLATNAMHEELHRAIGVERQEEQGKRYRAVLNDSVIETRGMESDSAGLILTSIPFSMQYEYTPSYNDFGHTDSNEHFFAQMDYLTPELLRVLKPGRVCAVHVKDRVVPGGMTGLGFQTVYPFHADCIRHFTGHGFALLGMKTIVTDVVRENNQTYRLGWTEQCKDGSRMGAGMPEYLLLFRKPPTDSSDGYADEPVVKDKARYSRSRWQVDAHGFMRSSGDRLLAPEDLAGLPHERIFKLFRQESLTRVYDFEHHVELGESLEAEGVLPVTFMLLQPQSWHPDVWTDVARMRTLNTMQAQADKEHHLCPMPFDLCDRIISQFSMPGETVFDPFAGLFTVPYCAVRLGRYGIGCELGAGYWADGLYYLRAAEAEIAAPTLFDAIEAEEEALTGTDA